MYKTEETKLKMFTFIIQQNNIQDINAGISVIFGYNLEDAFTKVNQELKKIVEAHPELKIVAQHKGTYEVDKLELESFMELGQTKVESVGDKLSGLLTYLLQDENAISDRKKLTKTDISSLEKIIKKL